MRRASYANRKLTDEEQKIVKEKYKMIASFVRRNRLKPIDEWESYLAQYYILAIMKYTDYEHLHQYGIEAIIYQSLKSAKGNYYSKMSRSKRRPEGGFLYYDEQDGKDAYISGFMVEAPPIGVEKMAISNYIVYDIYQEIESERQKVIIGMLMAGYKKVEIERYLDITYYRLQQELKNIREMIGKFYYNQYE